MEKSSGTVAPHSQAYSEVLDSLNTGERGLSEAESQTRLERYGANRLPPPTRPHPLRRFIRQFHNLLIYVLLTATIITALLEHWIDSGIIFAVIFINALIGFIQEGKAEQALDRIRDMLSPSAAVKRNGQTRIINAEQLVPGDIVLLQAGDKVPADLRLFKVRDLRIDEAILTGESVPIEKSDQPVSATAVISDRLCIAYSGTLVTYGQAYGVVIGTGEQTEIGRISSMLSHVHHLTTPLLRKINRFSKWLTLAIFSLAAATLLTGITLHQYTLNEMFFAAVGLAVAAIPEGLPAIITITLAIGVQRMAGRRAIIRRLPAVETLGSVTIICSDKTGTLTRNEMMVQNIISADALFNVSGEGYDPHGEFSVDGQAINPIDSPILIELSRAATLCNDAAIEHVENIWHMHGDPTEGALITLGMKAGLDLHLQLEEWPRTDVIPFDTRHKFMVTLHHDHAGHGFIYIKGAPEKLLDLCTSQRIRGQDQPLDHFYWQSQMEELAAGGRRLLAIAFKTAETGQRELTFNHIESGLTLLGVVGIIDPPRHEAIEAVKQCQAAGIHVKMITGDHATTAKAIAAQLGISSNGRVLSGSELDSLNDTQLAEQIDEVDIFARTSPEHKLRLVEVLQANDHVVAMTGDGVNDAPALKRADVGVAMGKKGTEVSKEAAEMVLTDDNFASISGAVEEGRTVYDNIRKAILFILPTNGGEAFTLIAAILLGHALPITPAQILWVNMITAVTLALALAFEPAEKDVMRRAPRPPSAPLLSRLLIWRILFVSLIIVSGTFGLFAWYSAQGVSIEYARTVAVNTLVMFEIFYLLNTRFILEPVLNLRGLFGNRYVLIAIAALLLMQMGFTYLPPAQTLFSTTGLSLESWLIITLTAMSVIFIIELEKLAVRRIMKNRANRADDAQDAKT